MARIEIKDLAANETLDADALKRVRGGLNFASVGLTFDKAFLKIDDHKISFLGDVAKINDFLKIK